MRLGTAPLAENNLLKRIETYLSLEYKLSQLTTLAGYEYIDVEHLRKKLVDDWQNMIRVRYGIGTRQISYFDFCTYVHFQLEGIINYYHYKRCNGICDVEWFNINLKQYLERANENRKREKSFYVSLVERINKKGEPTSLEDVNYNTKKIVFLNAAVVSEKMSTWQMVQYSKVLQEVQAVRNNESVHRSPVLKPVLDQNYSFEAIMYYLNELNTIVKEISK